MTRVLKRPMFRLGGPANEGITSGLAPRQGYAGDNTYGQRVGESAEERAAILRKAAGQQPDTSLSQFLIDFGLDIASRPPEGSILSTAAASAKEPFQGYKASKAARAGFEQKIGLAGATSAMAHSDKMKQIAAQAKNVDTALDDLTAYYLDEYKDYYVAKNRARFDLNLRADIARTFGDSQVGGIIDQDALSTEALTKKWMKKNGGKLDMVFYDINDGQIKKLVQQPGTGTLGFEVIHPSVLTGAAVDTSEQVQEQKVVSTGLSDAQAQVEAEKRGLILITRPEDATRGWRSERRRENPNGITKAELEEIIRKEEFSAATEHLKEKSLR